MKMESIPRWLERIKSEVRKLDGLPAGRPGPAARESWWSHPLKVLLLWLVVSCLLFARQPGALLVPSFYAEDGIVFFKQGYEQTFCSALFTYYAGYLHVVPRLLAGACGLLPLELVPRAYAVTALLTAAGCLTFFYTRCFRAVVDEDAIRAIVVLAMAFMPIPPELPVTLANMQWFLLLFGALCTLGNLPHCRNCTVALLVTFACAAASAPALVTTLPVLALRAWAARRMTHRMFWLVAAGIVVFYAASAGRNAQTLGGVNGEAIRSLTHAMSLRVVCFFAFGPKAAAALLPCGWPVVLYIAFVATLMMGLLGWHVWCARTVLTTALIYYVCVLSSLLLLRPKFLADFYAISEAAWAYHGRYFVGSLLLLCVLVGLCVDTSPIRLNRPRSTLFVFALWLGLHAFTFVQPRWNPHADWKYCADSWRQCSQLIRNAEASGPTSRTTIHVQVPPGDNWNFDLVVKGKGRVATN